MNYYETVVESCDPRGTLARLKLGRSRLACRRWPGVRRGERVTVRIRPEDVLLCADPPGRVSARNVLPGHVASLKHVPEGVYVTAEVGFPLTALVTHEAAAELRLRRGTPVFAVVKASVVGPDLELRARFRISLVGKTGLIDPQRIDFLRAIHRTGSLSAASRQLGITYRTAWLWAESVNRAWGKPLVASVHGGRGGGGAALTPEGCAALKLTERIERARP